MVDDMVEMLEAGASGPRELKQPGDPQWCWQTIIHLQTLWQAVCVDIDRYDQTWDEAEEHKVWEKVPYSSPYGSKEVMLERLAIGDKDVARRRIVAERAMKTQPLTQSGQGVTSRAVNQSHGKNANHLTALIARDYPEIWERMQKGEFSSVAEAARAAGIDVIAPKRIALGEDKNKIARSILDYYGPEEFREFVNAASRLLKSS